MEKVLKVTNALLAVIAVCLILIVAKVYKVDVPATAHAANVVSTAPQLAILMYYDGFSYKPVVKTDGRVPTVSR